MFPCVSRCPQDLEEENLAVRVGSLGVRWVLREHVDPWLLTVSSKHVVQSEVSPDAQQASSCTTKRCRRNTTREPGEPPAKRAEKDSQEREDAVGPPAVSTGEELGRQREEMENREQENNEQEGEGGEEGLPEVDSKTEGPKARELEPPAGGMPECSPAPTGAADAEDE